MVDPIVMFKDGGPFMYLILLCGLVAMLSPVLAGIAAATRFRIPAVVWWSVPLLTLMVGAVGTGLGLGLAESAIGAASEDVKQTMAEVPGVAMITDAAARMVAGPALVWLGACLALGTTTRSLLSKAERPWQVSAAATVAGAWLLGTVVSFGAAIAYMDAGPAVFLGPVGVACGGFSLILPALKGPPEEDTDERGRLASSRLAAGLAVSAGVAISAWTLVVLGDMQVFGAMARASAETRGVLVAHGQEMMGVGWRMMLISTGCALLPAAALSRDLRYGADTRGLVSAGLGAAICLVLLALQTWVGSLYSTVAALASVAS